MSNPSDRVHGTPPTNTYADNPLGSPGEFQDSLFLKTDVSPEEVFQAIGRLRKEARDEINRLIGFLDKTDDYVSRELEDDGTDGEQDDEPEDGADDEPSLGSSGHGNSGAISYTSVPISDGFQMIYDCEGDEHDGREPQEDDEPSLGSLERQVDQRLTMLASGLPWSVVDGEQ